MSEPIDPIDPSGHLTPAQIAAASRVAARGIAAALLRHPQLLDSDSDVAAITDEEMDVADAWCADVVRTVRYLYQRNPDGQIDMGLAFLKLVSLNRWDKARIPADLAELMNLEPTGASGALHAKLVRKLAFMRKIMRATGEMMNLVLTPGEQADPDQDNLTAGLTQILDTLTVDHTVRKSLRSLDRITDGVESHRQQITRRGPVLSTGFRHLDELLPSLEPGQLIVIGARPSVGKTALGIRIAVHASHSLGIPTSFFSLEMSGREIGQRLAYLFTGLPGHLFRSGRATTADIDELAGAIELTRKDPLWIDDTPGLRVAQIGAEARRIKRREGKLGLIVVDYLQLIAPANRREVRNEQVAQISRDLKLLAKELSVPVIALAQLNREVENRPDGKPKVSDLRETGSIEQDADVVMLLWRHPNQPDDAKIQTIGVIVAKQRNGLTGDVNLQYVRSCMRFEDIPIPGM